jgi:sugar lactone lactonase YvrE
LRRKFTAVAVLICVLSAVEVFAADKRKLRWVTSIYMDSKGFSLRDPEGVACAGSDLYVADTGNSRVLRYSYRDKVATPEAEFALPKSAPMMVQVDSQGNVYYLDGRDRRIIPLSAEGKPQGPVKPRGLPSSAEVTPKSFRIGPSDNLYVLDLFSGRVLVLKADGQYLRHVSFPESYGFFSDLTVDSDGTILLLDSVEAAVYSAAAEADGFSPLTKSLQAYMNFPTSLATDRQGMIYLVDQYGSGLALVDRHGTFLGRKLGLGWNESRLYYPTQLCISDDGNLFIADRSNSRIQVFSTGKN